MYFSEDHLQLTDLKPNTLYSVVVEARKLQKYNDTDSIQSLDDAIATSSFILTAQSDRFTLRTVRPPASPTGLALLSTTSNSVQVGWDAAKDKGAEVIGECNLELDHILCSVASSVCSPLRVLVTGDDSPHKIISMSRSSLHSLSTRFKVR